MGDLQKFYMIRGYWDTEKPPKYVCQQLMGDDGDFIYTFSFPENLLHGKFDDEFIKLFRSKESALNFLKSKKIFSRDDMVRIEIVSAELTIEVANVD